MRPMRLSEWCAMHDEENDEYVIWGLVYGDPLRRWREGTRIHTSGINKSEFPPEELEEGMWIKTRNSVYVLGVEGPERFDHGPRSKHE